MYDVGRRCGSDPPLLWLWYRLAATAPIGPLAWEPPYAAGAAQEIAKRQKKKKKKDLNLRPDNIKLLEERSNLEWIKLGNRGRDREREKMVL